MLMDAGSIFEDGFLNRSTNGTLTTKKNPTTRKASR